MRKIKEMLRLHFEVGLTNRQIARSLSVSHSTVNDLLGRFQVAGLNWPLPEDRDEATLEAELYSGNTGHDTGGPDWNQTHRELSRKGVTLLRLPPVRTEAPLHPGEQCTISQPVDGLTIAVGICGRLLGLAERLASTKAEPFLPTGAATVKEGPLDGPSQS